MGHQLQHTELEGNSQPSVVWLEKHNHGIYLVVVGKEGHDVVEVLLVLLSAPAVPNSRGINKVEPCGACLNYMLLRRLSSRLPTGKNLICVRSKCNVLFLSIFVSKRKPETLIQNLS